jgi:hypothetical protein
VHELNRELELAGRAVGSAMPSGGPDFDPNVVDVVGIENELAKLAKRWSQARTQGCLTAVVSRRLRSIGV